MWWICQVGVRIGTRLGLSLRDKYPQRQPIQTLEFFYPIILRAYPRLILSLCVKFDDCRCKGKAVMRQEPIFSHQCIVILTYLAFLPRYHKGISWTHKSLCVKLHDYRCEDKVIMHRQPFSGVNVL